MQRVECMHIYIYIYWKQSPFNSYLMVTRIFKRLPNIANGTSKYLWKICQTQCSYKGQVLKRCVVHKMAPADMNIQPEKEKTWIKPKANICTHICFGLCVCVCVFACSGMHVLSIWLNTFDNYTRLHFVAYWCTSANSNSNSKNNMQQNGAKSQRLTASAVCGLKLIAAAVG